MSMVVSGRLKSRRAVIDEVGEPVCVFTLNYCVVWTFGNQTKQDFMSKRSVNLVFAPH